MAFFPSFSLRKQKIGLVFVNKDELLMHVPKRFSVWQRSVKRSSHLPDDELNNFDPPVSRWLVLLPSYHCGFRHVTIPADDLCDIERMLSYEVPRLLPCSVSEWVWGFQILEKEEGASKVLLTFSPLNVVEELIERLSGLRIKPIAIIPSASYHAAVVASNGNGQDGIQAYLGLNSESLECTVVHDKQVVSFREIMFDRQEIGITSLLQKELERSKYLFSKNGESQTCVHPYVVYTNKEFATDVENFVGRWKGAVNVMQQESSVDKVLCRSFLNKRVRSRSAANDSSSYMNLLPQRIKDQQSQRKYKKKLLVNGLKVVLACVLIFYCLQAIAWRQNRKIYLYEQRMREIGPQALKLEGLQKQLAIIHHHLHGQIPTLDVIAELYRHLPQDVTVHSLLIEKGTHVTVRAQAQLLSQAFECIGYLEQSPYLVNVRETYANQRQIENNVLIDFEVKAEFQKAHAREAR